MLGVMAVPHSRQKGNPDCAGALQLGQWRVDSGPRALTGELARTSVIWPCSPLGGGSRRACSGVVSESRRDIGAEGREATAEADDSCNVDENGWAAAGVTTARAGGEARSDMRFPQFVQNMIPVGLSHPQLPQRMPPQ
jgi:hypothetical protein